jgi:hypothetical protein
MQISKSVTEWGVVALVLVAVGVVFQQAGTNMAEQGIASGGPYNNAAAYPQLIAIVLALLVSAQAAMQVVRRREGREKVGVSALRRPAAVVGVFALYIVGWGVAGYHLATPLMLAALMGICGLRGPLQIGLIAIGVPLALAFVFEAWLRIVLPGGLFQLNIAW